MKKWKLIFVLLLLPIVCICQVTLSTDEVDEFEGTIKKFTNMSKNVFKGEKTLGTLYMGVARVDSVYFLTFLVAEDLGCLSQYDGKCMIKLTDGTIIECLQVSDTDCSSTITSAQYLAAKRDEAEMPDVMDIIKDNNSKLSTIPIEKIRIYGSESYNDYIPHPKFKDFPADQVLILHFQAVE